MYGTTDAALVVMRVAGPVRQLFITPDKEVLYMVLGDRWFEMVTDGDCCSHTWIDSMENVDALLGHEIVSVEDVWMENESRESEDAAYARYESEHGYPSECLRSYAMKLTTDAGITTIIYRNSSNGYYGGTAEWDVLRNRPTRTDLREITDDF